MNDRRRREQREREFDFLYGAISETSQTQFLTCELICSDTND